MDQQMRNQDLANQRAMSNQDLANEQMRSQDLANALANAAPGVLQLQPPPAANQSDKEKADLFYKTELCKHWEKESACPYGDKCQFAHGRHQLRFVVRSKKYKTKRCKTFWSTGHCPYGSRCCFLHDPEEDARLLSDMTTFIFDQATGETIATTSPNQRGNKPKKQDRRQRKGSMGAVGESVPQSSISTFNQVMGIDPGEKPPQGAAYGGKKQPRGGPQQQARGGKGAPARHGGQAMMGNRGHNNKKHPSNMRKSQSFQNSQEVDFKGQMPNEEEMNGRGKSFSAASTFMPGFGDGNLGLGNNDWLFSSQPAEQSDFLFNAPPQHAQQQATWSTGDISNLGVGLDGLTLNGNGVSNNPEVVPRVGSSSSGEAEMPASNLPSNIAPNMAPDLATNLVDPHQPGLFNASYNANIMVPETSPIAPPAEEPKNAPQTEEGGEEAFLQNASNFLLQTAA
jgi:hypothetical protein